MAISARPPRWLAPHAGLSELGLAILCLGGGARWNPAGPATTLRSFSADDAMDIVRNLRTAFPGVKIGIERADHPVLDAEYPREDGLDPDWFSISVEDAIADSAGYLPIKIVALRPGADNDGGPATKTVSANAEDEAFFAKVIDLVGDKAVLAYSGSPGLAELFPPTVSKAQALVEFADSLEIAADDIWAFGDQPNDLPMLQWAGTGFCVANANPQLQAAEGIVNLDFSNDQDGVARQLSHCVG